MTLLHCPEWICDVAADKSSCDVMLWLYLRFILIFHLVPTPQNVWNEQPTTTFFCTSDCGGELVATMHGPCKFRKCLHNYLGKVQKIKKKNYGTFPYWTGDSPRQWQLIIARRLIKLKSKPQSSAMMQWMMSALQIWWVRSRILWFSFSSEADCRTPGRDFIWEGENIVKAPAQKYLLEMM